MSFSLDIALDAASLKRVAAFSYYPTILDVEFTAAMQASVELLEASTYADMWETFTNPTGQLEDSLGYGVDSPYQAWMGTDSPYGRRRNYGFSGMTDALGRFYPHDVGIHWAERAVLVNENKIKKIFNDALLITAYKLELGYP